MLRRIVNNLYVFWALLAVPAVFIFARYLGSPHDVEPLLHPTGEYSVRLMIIAMALSPLRELLGPRKWLTWLIRRRRSMGVAAFAYALLHLLFYLIDMGVWDQIWEDAKIFSIWTGYIAFAIFTAMALTSNDASMRFLRSGWKRLQRFVYAAALLVFLHWGYVHDGWTGALVHFVPLAALEIVRTVHIFTKRSRNSAQTATN